MPTLGSVGGCGGDPIAAYFIVRRVAGAVPVFHHCHRAQNAGDHRMSVPTKSPLSPIADLFWRPTGPLTQELLLAPGRFGLGRVPAGKKPDATTSMVCGFCATGCGLNIHLREGKAVN